MAALPYMRVYVQEWLGDTRHLSLVERGAYFDLICYYWNRGGPIPSDDVQIARLLGISRLQWLKIRAKILNFFEEKDGFFHHFRVNKEIEKSEAKVLKAKGSALAGVERRQSKRAARHTSDVNKVSLSSSGEEEKDTCAPERVLCAWNAMAEAAPLPTAPKLTDKRRSSLKARIGEHGEQAIVDAIAKVPASSFLMGRTGGAWRANLDDLIRPGNMAKLVSGAYHRDGEMVAATRSPKSTADRKRLEHELIPATVSS